MTNTENKIGGARIDRWVKVQDAACSVCYEFYVNQFLLGSLYKTKGIIYLTSHS